MNFTVPGNLCRMAVSTSAVAIRIAVCASCPQACMTSTSRPRYLPLALDANGKPSGSLTGSASISARQRHDRPRLLAFEDRDNTGARDAGLHLEPELGEVRGNQAGGSRLLLPEFRMLMNVTPPCDQLAFDLRGTVADFLFK